MAFGSDANNLVPGDTNNAPDIFLRDRATGILSRISVTSAGAQANGGSAYPALSGDGRYISFRSIATNLDPADTDPKPDIYRHDRVTGETVLVSVRLTPGTSVHGAWNSVMSHDGRFVAFDCYDDGLVPGDKNGPPDVYVRDMQTGVMELVSVGSQGELGNSISGDPSISADGRFVAFGSLSNNWFPGNPNQYVHAYVRDRHLGTTTLVSYAPSGTYGPVGGGGRPSISADGSKVAFMYLGPDIMPPLFAHLGHTWPGAQVFVRDLQSGALEYVGYTYTGKLSSHECRFPKLSADGRYIAWESLSDDLTATPGDHNQNIFWRDLETGVTVLVSRGMGGAAPNGWSVDPAISADGRTVAFASQANNLVPGDTGWVADIFVRECDVTSPTNYCLGKQGASGCAPALSFQGTPSFSAGSGFDLTGDGLVASSSAIVMYSTAGSLGGRLFDGVLCIQAPIRRSPVFPTGGTSPGCDGSLDFDMNAWIASGADATLVAGVAVYAQAWCRDPADPFQSALTDAVAFVIGP